MRKERRWALGLPKGEKTLSYALFAGSNAIQDQLAGEEDVWEKLWTRDTDVDIQRELGGCDLNPRYEVGDIKAAASRFEGSNGHGGRSSPRHDEVLRGPCH